MLRLLLLIINTGVLLSLCGCGSTESETEAASRTYQIDPNDPNATAIYDATLTHAVASPIASSIITDPEERKRWSSNVDLQTGYHEYWVAPDVAMGQGSGTREDPWDLYTTLKGEHTILPNTILWMKAGDYISPIAPITDAESPPALWPTKIAGRSGNAVHIRPEKGARVRMDGGFTFWWPGTDHVWVWDVEITDLPGDYRSALTDHFLPLIWDGSSEGILEHRQYFIDHGSYRRNNCEINGGDGNHVINTVIHHTGGGINSWKRAENAVIYGNTVFDVGYEYNRSSTGTGFYAQNESGTTREYSENLLMGSYGNPLQIYSATGEAGLSQFEGTGNVLWGLRQRLVSGANARDKVMFGSQSVEPVGNIFRENYAYGLNIFTPENDPVDMVFHDNKIFYSRVDSCLACDDLGNLVERFPSSVQIDLRPNRYDPRRANLVVVNPHRDPVISISLGSFASAGDTIQVYNTTDPSAPIVEGVYNGSYFNLPMNGYDDPRFIPTISAYPFLEINPADSVTPFDFSSVKQEFWAFILIKNP